MKLDRHRESIRLRLDTTKQRLAMYYEAEEKILSGSQGYTIGKRSLTRADLAEIRREIDALETKVWELEKSAITGSTRNKTVRVLYRDL